MVTSCSDAITHWATLLTVGEGDGTGGDARCQFPQCDMRAERTRAWIWPNRNAIGRLLHAPEQFRPWEREGEGKGTPDSNSLSAT
jgi:hypothetical protein